MRGRALVGRWVQQWLLWHINLLLFRHPLVVHFVFMPSFFFCSHWALFLGWRETVVGRVLWPLRRLGWCGCSWVRAPHLLYICSVARSVGSDMGFVVPLQRAPHLLYICSVARSVGSDMGFVVPLQRDQCSGKAPRESCWGFHGFWVTCQGLGVSCDLWELKGCGFGFRRSPLSLVQGAQRRGWRGMSLCHWAFRPRRNIISERPHQRVLQGDDAMSSRQQGPSHTGPLRHSHLHMHRTPASHEVPDPQPHYHNRVLAHLQSPNRHLPCSP